MPKFDYILKPGEEIPEEFTALLKRRLSPAQLTKLLKHGGLIRLSIAAPYVERKRGKTKIEITADYLTKLQALRANDESLAHELTPLTISQLKEICKLLGKPVRSEASSGEIRSQIIHSLKAGDMWAGISAAKPVEDPDSE